MERASGILLHITSLPNDYGLGCFSTQAYDFISFLHSAKVKVWQVLPFAHNNYGESPYSGFSAFAGNPYFIDLREFLSTKELLEVGFKFNECRDYNDLQFHYDQALKLIYEQNKKRIAFALFEKENEYWLQDYAMFMAIKQVYNATSFNDFPQKLKLRDLKELKKFELQHLEQINYYKFLQYIFYSQWQKIKTYANKLHIKIMGDVPIYLNPFSSDVWAHPDYFMVQSNLQPLLVAGTPPDYFSSTGQLWDNPVYNYSVMASDNFTWWVNRIKHLEKFFDAVKMDHFRGFSSYWAVPFGETDAQNGKWYSAPGKELFNQIAKQTTIKIIAEDLGVITSDVHELLKFTKYPRMKVLQFAFDSDQRNPYLPHNIEKNSVAYIGTHDNDTIIGFLEKCDTPKLNSIKQYYNMPYNSNFDQISEKFIESLFSCNSDWSIFTMQDLLKQDSEYRMNIPGTIFGNWKYKVNINSLSVELAEKLKQYNLKYNR